MPPRITERTEVSLKLVGQLLLVILGAILFLRASYFAGYALFVFVIYTLNQKKVEFSFFALMLLISLAIMNPVFFEKDRVFYITTRLSILALAFGMGFKARRLRAAFLAPFTILFVYMGCIMVTSLWGWAPVISELKAILFLFFMLALIYGVSVVVQRGVDIRFIRAGMLAICCFFILGSVAVIPFPQIGRSMYISKLARWGIDASMVDLRRLFNGATWHSQTLGPLLAMLNAFLLSDYLCSFKRKNWLYRILIACIPVLVYMTSSRTAFFAYLISILSVVFFFRGEHQVAESKRRRVVTFAILGVLLVTLILSFIPVVSLRVESFLRKERDVTQISGEETLSYDLFSSRKGLMERALVSFRESPLIGHGFQVTETMQGYRFWEHGFAFSAPVEKGVLAGMILEEGGVIGMAIFIIFLFALYVTYRRLAFTCFLSTFTVFLGLNSGEAAFFSTSGGGGILWMVCFCAMLMDIHRHRSRLAENEQRRRGAVQDSFPYEMADA